MTEVSSWGHERLWVRRRPPEDLGAVPSGEERKAVMGTSRGAAEGEFFI